MYKVANMKVYKVADIEVDIGSFLHVFGHSWGRGSLLFGTIFGTL